MTRLEQKKFVQNFEKYLSNQDLLEFQDSASTGLWTGSIEKQALFDYWLQINDISTGRVIN